MLTGLDEIAQQSVAAGAAVLDQKIPGWWDVINVAEDVLNINDPSACIIGQIETALDEGRLVAPAVELTEFSPYTLVTRSEWAIYQLVGTPDIWPGWDVFVKTMRTHGWWPNDLMGVGDDSATLAALWRLAVVNRRIGAV